MEQIGSFYDDVRGFNVFSVRNISNDCPSKYIAILLTSEIT